MWGKTVIPARGFRLEDVESVLIEQLVDKTVYCRRVQIPIEQPANNLFPMYSNLGIRRARS